MAIRYVDLVNGNDANNGTTFALRKKTLTSASTGLTGGDTIRIMKSDDPTSLGSCTWPTNGKAITLGTAVNAAINTCESGWTASTNITASYSTTGTDVHQGTNCLSLAIASAFTTGKVAYATCATTDLSGYQQISFWFRNSVAIAANQVYIDLCSDATGDVPIVSFALPVKAASSTFTAPITLDYGANLPNNVASIAIRCASDPGTPTLIFDNFIACKDKTSTDSLTLNSLIGLNTINEPEWFPIKAIEGTTVTLDISHVWCGSTGSLTTYKLEPLRQQNLQGAAGLISGNSGSTQYPGWMPSVGGTQSAYLNIEFGWDTTDMSTQTGYTAVDFQVYSGHGVPNGVSGGYNYIGCNKLIVSRVQYVTAASTSMKWGEIHCIAPIEPRLCSGGNIEFDKVYVTCIRSSSAFTANGSTIGNTLVYKHGISSVTSPQSSGFGGELAEIGTVVTHGILAFTLQALSRGHVINFTMRNNANNSASGYTGLTGSSTSNFKIVNLAFEGPFSNFIMASANIANFNIVNLTYNTSPVAAAVNVTGYSSQNINIQNFNNTGQFRNYSDKNNMISITGANTHNATGVAWEITANNPSISNARSDWYSISNVWIGEVPVKANKLVTISLWARRQYNTSQGCLFVKPFFPGITSAVTSQFTTTAAWEQLSITFTPTIDTVVPIYFGVQYDATNTTQTFRIDDFNVTQAD